MRFSNYMQQCLTELEMNREYDTDALLVQLVRLQNITEKIVRLNNKDDIVDLVPAIPRAPLSAYQAAFQTELDNIDQSLSKSLRNNSKTSASRASSLPTVHTSLTLVLFKEFFISAWVIISTFVPFGNYQTWSNLYCSKSQWLTHT